MHAIEKQLYRDHYHLQRLLEHLDQEVRNYECGMASSVELPLILDTLDYIRFYPERWHHPMEDKIFDRIMAKRPLEADFVNQVQLEHQQLAQLTRYMTQLFDAVANDCVVPVSELVRTTREFIQRQRSHIDRENEMVYPLMEKYLTEADWEELEAEIAMEQDPLFDAPLKADYQNLFMRVVDGNSKSGAQALR
jgi:hemerythrin-like domain-containing protein